jgi:hypothetical protein
VAGLPDMTWLTIDTAPRDGTRILASWQGTDEVEIVSWDELNERWEYPDGSAPFGLTHWMPLPAGPPNQGSTEERT